jgi:hypothetical protein
MRVERHDRIRERLPFVRLHPRLDVAAGAQSGRREDRERDPLGDDNGWGPGAWGWYQRLVPSP